jgi:hypothetical protein
MSLSGIPQHPLLSALSPVSRPAPGGAAGANGGRPAVADPAIERSVIERAPAPRPAITAAPSTVPAEAPPGTDPALWSVLTTEERTFFARTASLGPLTYGKIKSATLPAPPAVRGGRLDVRA